MAMAGGREEDEATDRMGGGVPLIYTNDKEKL